MSHNKKRFARESAKKQTPLGLVVTVSTAFGLVIGSAVTYYFSKPPPAPPAAGGTPQAQNVTMVPQQKFTPAPQPPGEVPPGKVWSVEHGHWHDAPPPTAPPSATATASATPTPAPDPAAAIPFVTPAPAAAPAEKKQ